MCFSLDPAQRQGIARRRQQTHDYRLGMRLSAFACPRYCCATTVRPRLRLPHLLGVCARTVRNWLCLYRKKGLDALCILHYGGDPGELTSSQG
jgi:hypothetical protein